MTTGPRPAGVTPKCFAPENHDAARRAIPALIGVDRIYVTWSKFLRDRRLADLLQLLGRPGPFLVAREGDQRLGGVLRLQRRRTSADFNQGSVPTVNPTTGYL